jgi:flavodoxin
VTTRIPVPASKVRTDVQILEGQTIVNGYIWVDCHNCGGSGNYPSSMSPPGKCRFYCWKDRTPATYGKLPVEVAKFVHAAQARDRADYRREVQYVLDAPKRAQAALEAEAAAEQARIEKERQEADVAARRAISKWIGKVGERLELELTVVRVASYETVPYGSYSRNTVTRYVITMRDAQGNVVVWFADYGRTQGEQLKLRGTVKEHSQYEGEAQTIIQRVKEL